MSAMLHYPPRSGRKSPKGAFSKKRKEMREGEGGNERGMMRT